MTLCAALALGVAGAQSLGYTVQVIAVSDQANALDLSRGLLREGFPAYVVRSTGAQGDVYRVRVGAFANRAAAARYAAAMPDIGGARPVPALAEAIPGGIMPLAPRVVWQDAAAGADLRVLPWPAGIALRRQVLVPLAPATYVLVQDAEVRTVQAWRAAPLTHLPPSPALEVLDVPFVDLAAPAEADDETDGAPVEEGEATADEGAIAGPRYAEADPATGPEAGLLLLRDRPLWPTVEVDADPERVREVFRAATVALVADRLGLDRDTVDAAAYHPAGGEMPALVVVEVSDRSGRDLGDVRALGDPVRGLRFDGPPMAGAEEGTEQAAAAAVWWPPAVAGTRLRVDTALSEPAGGERWTLSADGAFVRITTADGASWRAVAGALLWTDGRHALVRDGDEVVLVDFLPR